VRAPASKLGIERLSEPQDTYEERKLPTMLDRPWPRNSRLASTCWPERSATALAIEIDWPSGLKEQRRDLEINRVLVLKEPASPAP